MANKLDLYNDNELIALIAEGNEGALSTLYYRYYETLCSHAVKRLKDETIVEELVQDVFINLWNKAAELDHQGNIKSYLFATLRNKVLHEIRASIVLSRHQITLLQKEESYAPDAMELICNIELERKIQFEVQRLSPQCRAAFSLSRLENLSYKSIAMRMNISVNTVEKHIGKALGILRKSLKESDVLTSFLIIVSISMFK